MKREHDVLGIQDEFAINSGSCDQSRRMTVAEVKNILIVEDNPVACKALENLLSKLGEQADIAIDGEQAIEKTKIHNYRLILMDLALPGKDGCAVTKIIRQREKAHKLRPAYIVAQSSHMNKEVEKQCLTAGMNVCCAKPLTAKIIQELLNTIVKNENLILVG